MRFIQIIKNNISIQKLNYTLIALIVLLCFANIIVLINNTIDREAVQKSVTRQPESFTELYFENHTHLPELIAEPNDFSWYRNPRTNLYKFSFTINNLENKDMTYEYEVSSFEHEKVVIDKGIVQIKKNESETITENFTLPNIHSRTKVTVKLINKNQQIAFWIGENIYENQ